MEWKRFGRGPATPGLGDLLAMVITHLLTGMILQAGPMKISLQGFPFQRRFHSHYRMEGGIYFFCKKTITFFAVCLKIGTLAVKWFPHAFLTNSWIVKNNSYAK